MLLAVAAVVWVGIHVGIAGTAARGWLVQRLGAKGFLAAYSLLSVVSIAALCASYKMAATEPLWFAPDWLRWVLVALMLPAFVLFVASVASPNPTAMGSELRPASEARGWFRITRHPMLWGFAIWGLVHIVANGDSASLWFFGAFAVTALAGMPSIDAKLAKRDPVRWGQLAATTSIVPGAAIGAGRNRLVWGELGWIAPVVGGALWMGMMFGHPVIVGVSALPQ